MNLNIGQETAKSHKDGPMMVIAGPGSGKTTVIVYRVKHLIDEFNIEPNKILVITYTKVAATHMEQRYKRFGMGNVDFSTFHGLFFKILKKHTTISLDSLIKEDERTYVLKSIIKSLNIELDEDTLQNISSEISLINNDMLSLDYYNSLSIVNDDFRAIFNGYITYKEENKKIDFDDMLTKCYELFLNNDAILRKWQSKYKYIMIDEFQDINKIQYKLIRLLCQKNQNIYIVGDDDQSIYKFRGARPQFLLDFPKDFNNVATAVLDVNYRSSEEIIKVANNIIKHNKMRYNKLIKGVGRSGNNPILIKCKDIDQEAKYIANKIKSINISLDEVCIVYRTNIQSRAFVDAFSLLNIPYRIKEEMPSVYEHFVSKDICAYMGLALDINDNVSLERIINKPKRYISKGIITQLKGSTPLIEKILTTNYLKHWQKKPVEELLYHLGSLKKMSPYKAIKYIRKNIGYNEYVKEYASYRKISYKGLYEILDELTEATKNFKSIEEYLEYVENPPKLNDTKSEGVQLSTIHGVKGLEYKCVFVVSCIESLMPHEKSQTDEEIEEERRLFYVAITRAKDTLYLSIIENRYEIKVEPTRFLKGVIKDE